MLTEGQSRDYEGKGHLVIENAIDGSELSQLRKAFEKAAGSEALDDLPNQDICFLRFAEHGFLFPIVHSIMSDDVRLRSLVGLIHEPGDSGRGWHREVGSMLGVNHYRSNMFVQVYIFLDDVVPGGSCPVVVPSSQSSKSAAGISNSLLIDEVPEHKKIYVPAGSAVILHGNILQARTENRSDRMVRCLEYTYVHSWMRQALGALNEDTIKWLSTAEGNLAHLFGTTPYKRYWEHCVEGYPSSKGLPARNFSPLRSVGKETESNF